MNLLLAIIKPLLYPISILYGGVMWLRNKLYDLGLCSSIRFDLPVIAVGNLSTGGTGKTPHIEYLIKLLQPEYKVATMSRGYKRRTKGFYLANENTDATMIGDEPMQFYLKFPGLTVSVCEERITGIPRLLGEQPEVDVILLDDAFQHRSVNPGLNILVVDFAKPFYKDYILPFGNLRESRKAYKRADIIIISKCPPLLSDAIQQEMMAKIMPRSHQQVYFSGITYGTMIDFFTRMPLYIHSKPNVIMLSGIATPEPMLEYLHGIAAEIHLLRYPDHHYYTPVNLEEIKQAYGNWDAAEKMIVTTEKDAARLILYKKELAQWNVRIAILPITISLLGGKTGFDVTVKNYILEAKKAMGKD